MWHEQRRGTTLDAGPASEPGGSARARARAHTLGDDVHDLVAVLADLVQHLPQMERAAESEIDRFAEAIACRVWQRGA